MATNWVELTESGTQKKIHINLEQASSIERPSDDGTTTIWFLAGHPDGKVEVDEEPKVIFKLAKKTKA